MRQVSIVDCEVIVHGVECTGVAARWCPVCGECTDDPELFGDERYSHHCSDDECPLHGWGSRHAEPLGKLEA